MSSDFVQRLLRDRRDVLRSSLAFGLGGALGLSAPSNGATGKATRTFDYADPATNLYAFGKIWAGYEEPVIGAYHGLMYARLPGKRMIPIFGYTGTGVLLARQEPTGELWVKSRETGYFTDLATGDILEEWHNPFTGRTVPVYHFYNDMLVGKIGLEIPKFLLGGAGDSPTLMNEGTVFPDATGRYPFVLPFDSYGDDMMLSWDYTHEYTNPVTPQGWPRSSTGVRITPSEHFTFNFSRRALEDRSLPTVRFTAGFSRLSECWPFMQMGGTPFADMTVFGRMFSHKGLGGHRDVPPKVLDYIEKHAPESLTLPAGWKPNVSRLDTWKTYAADVPPENPEYPWKPGSFRVPSGQGRRERAD